VLEGVILMELNITRTEPLAPKAPAKKRVAAYARVSSGKDAMLHSLSAQISYYSEYIQNQRGWEYMGVYSDEALSGTKENRPEFQRLLTDCRNGKIDMIITKSISRLTRNTVTMLEVVRELKSLNVDVLFEKENIHSMSGDGELMLTILASFAQAESLSVSENCKWRIRKQFQDGELANLRFMYGYNIIKGDIEIDPEQAEIVRMIFDDYINGMGCSLIARKLRDMNVATLMGGTWNSERIAAIIKNEKYTGNALLQKKYRVDHLTKALVWNKGVLPKYYAENTHPLIIDAQTFKTAQDIMAENRAKNYGQKATSHYPFTGKIHCTCCGKHYKRKTVHGCISWNCSTYLQFGKSFCHTKQIPEDILLSITAEVLGITSFDESTFVKNIKEIQVPEFNKLVFVFFDGRLVKKSWENKSRKDSWSDEAKQQAREHRLEYLKRSNNSCKQQKQ
jgi:site-specific DNA recombinase